jgi:predicted S18 family serine protease
MIDELINHSKQERSLTEQAEEEAQSIREAADKLASQHYDSIITDYQERARTYKESKLDEAEQRLDDVKENAEQERQKISNTRNRLDDHAAAIVNQVKTILNDNT